jgi:hypothetical protein
MPSLKPIPPEKYGSVIGKTGGSNAYTHNYNYHPRIRERGVQDPNNKQIFHRTFVGD